MPSSLVLSWWFHGYLKCRLAHLSWSLYPPSGVIIQPFLHLHELSLLLPSFSLFDHVLACLFWNSVRYFQLLFSFASVLMFLCCSSSFLLQFKSFVRWNLVFVLFNRCLCLFFQFNRFNLTIIGTSKWVWVLVLVVRKDGFKLEGGEWFKGVFANFSKLEWTYFRNQLIQQFS